MSSHSLSADELQYRLKRAELDTDNYIRRLHEANSTLEKLDAEVSELRAVVAAVRQLCWRARKDYGNCVEYRVIGHFELRDALGKFAETPE